MFLFVFGPITAGNEIAPSGIFIEKVEYENIDLTFGINENCIVIRE